MRRVILPGFVLLCSLWRVEASDPVSEESPPNVVLLMGDDHGWEETGYNGHPHLRTPVLDEMAATGIRFERFYAAHPNCSPTRASVLTGRHPNRMGTFAPGWSMRPEEVTLAHVLGNAGYRCGHFGKWHVGAVKKESPVCPGALGFHEWVSHDNFFELNPVLSRNGEPPEVFSGESSQILVDEAVRFINGAVQEGRPFLTVIWFGSPHEPYSALPEDLSLYDDLPSRYARKVRLTSNETGEQVERTLGEVLRERYAEITAMDRAIGRFRSFLKDSGLRDRTIVFYCGDNGTSADGKLLTPHRGVKSQVYDGGLLVPGLMEWPDGFEKPMTTSLRSTTCDLLPTICSATLQRIPERPLDGIDLNPLLRNGDVERPAPIFFWEYPISSLSSRNTEPYIDPVFQQGTTPLAKLMNGKATRDFRNVRFREIGDEDYRGARAIIRGQWKLVIHEQKNRAIRRELFDLDADPAERNDQLATRASLAEEMEHQLRTWQSSVLHSLTGGDYVPE